MCEQKKTKQDEQFLLSLTVQSPEMGYLAPAGAIHSPNIQKRAKPINVHGGFHGR